MLVKCVLNPEHIRLCSNQSKSLDIHYLSKDKCNHNAIKYALKMYIKHVCICMNSHACIKKNMKNKNK